MGKADYRCSCGYFLSLFLMGFVVSDVRATVSIQGQNHQVPLIRKSNLYTHLMWRSKMGILFIPSIFFRWFQITIIWGSQLSLLFLDDRRLMLFNWTIDGYKYFFFGAVKNLNKFWGVRYRLPFQALRQKVNQEVIRYSVSTF